MQQKQILINWNITSYLCSDNFDPKKSLLFLHGWWQSKLSFEKIYKILDKKNISYIALDFPWFWTSGIPKNNWWVHDYADFTKDFIENLELEKPILVWHSFWWRVCIILGWIYENLSKIVMIWAAWIKAKTNKLNYLFTKTWKAIFSIPGFKWIWNKIKNKVWSRDYLNAWKLKIIFLNVVNKDLTDLLLYIKFPTLLIRWLKDEETPVADWIKMDKMIKDSKLKIFDKWTHFVFQEFPEEVWEEIEKFI